MFAAVFLAFLASLLTHYIFGGIRLAAGSAALSRAARIQLISLVGVLVLLNVVAVGAGDALLVVAILPGTQDNEWSLCSSENFATIRTITGWLWCGFTMVKAMFFCKDLGDERCMPSSLTTQSWPWGAADVRAFTRRMVMMVLMFSVCV